MAFLSPLYILQLGSVKICVIIWALASSFSSAVGSQFSNLFTWGFGGILHSCSIFFASHDGVLVEGGAGIVGFFQFGEAGFFFCRSMAKSGVA